MNAKLWTLMYLFTKELLKNHPRQRSFGYFLSKGLHIQFRTPILNKPSLEISPSETREAGSVLYAFIAYPPFFKDKERPKAIENFITKNKLEDSVFFTDTGFTPSISNEDLTLFAETFLGNTHLFPSLSISSKRYRILPIENRYGNGILIFKEVLFWSKTMICLLPTSCRRERNRHYLLAVNSKLPLRIKEDISLLLKDMLENPDELPLSSVSFAEIPL